MDHLEREINNAELVTNLQYYCSVSIGTTTRLYSSCECDVKQCRRV